jgi:arginyl-tRNA synthetase
MQNDLRGAIRSAINVVIKNLRKEGAFFDSELPFVVVEIPADPSHGDYATNVALSVAKLVGKKPLDIAEMIAEKLKSTYRDLFDDVRAAPPGFINFFLRDDFLLQSLGQLLKNPAEWGKSSEGTEKTILVEYFQLNIAKRPHIGHLRSAVIGDALKRMFRYVGYTAVSDTHVGDWGTQFGILLLAFRENKVNKEDIEQSGDPFGALEKLYQEENARIEADPIWRDQAKEEFAKLERGDQENRKIWEWMVEISMKKLEESALRLELLPFDEHRGESSYEDAMPKIAELALAKKVAKKLSDGAIVVDLTSDKLDEAVLVKSDGASTYLLRDLATIQYRKEHWKFSKNLYVVDVRQSHHFKQLFRVAELLGFEGVGESEHIEFGFMSLPEGAMSTRAGTAISLEAVLNEATKRARAAIQEKNPELKNADAVAEAVGIGAIKYFDLSHHRKSDIVFRWDEALSFNGNTGPYLQYTYARLNSILRKVETSRETALGTELDALEHQLLVALIRFPEAIRDAIAEYAPNTLANYLYNLSKLANEFYHSHPVSQESDLAKQNVRIALVSGVRHILRIGLALLGIQTPEEM